MPRLNFGVTDFLTAAISTLLLAGKNSILTQSAKKKNH
jgi:hypothetical protein